MTSTKTKTSPKAGSIEAHRQREAEAASEYAAAGAAADEAAASIPQREAAAEAAEEHVGEIRASWRRGLDTYTADDLNRAQAEAERTAALLAGAQSIATREERNAKPTDTAVAEIVARAVTDVYDWMPTVSTFLAPNGVADAETAVYVSQAEPTKRTGLGVVSGTVDLTACLDRRYRPLTASAVVDALTARGHRAIVTPSPKGIAVRLGEVEWSHWRVKVEAGHEAVPFIALDPTEATARMFGRTVLGQSGRQDFTGEVKSANVSWTDDGDGVRATTASALIVGHFYSVPGRDRYSAGSSLLQAYVGPETAAPIFSRVLSDLPGRFVEGLGVVESIEHEHEPDAGARHQHGHRVTATFTSRSAPPQA